MADDWLPTLLTDTPRAGYELAIKLARMTVKMTQPDARIRDELREVYARDADSLIHISHVVVVHFQTVAAANGYWREQR